MSELITVTPLIVLLQELLPYGQVIQHATTDPNKMVRFLDANDCID